MRFSIAIPLEVIQKGEAIAQGSAVAERMGNRMDQDPFQAFYQETATKLWAYIRRAASDATLADDIFQETFLRFLRTSPARLDERQQRAYLYRTATSLLVDHWRRVKRERQWGIKSFFEERTPHPSHLAQDIAHLFAQLKPQQQALLWLAYVEGFDHREIASTLQLREKSVRVLLYRARKRMAGILTTHGFGPPEV